MERLTVLGSVFLPRESLEPFAGALADRGYEVTISVPRASGSAATVLRDYETATAEGSVLIAHSNAGNFIPALTRLSPGHAVLFMDAALPPFAGGEWPVVPSAAAAQLRRAATRGALPPWTQWWDRNEIAALFGSRESFERIDAVAPAVSASFLDVKACADPGWPVGLQAAYLALSDGYVEDAKRAAALGWPIENLALGHLGMLREPTVVADRAAALVNELATIRRPPVG